MRVVVVVVFLLGLACETGPSSNPPYDNAAEAAVTLRPEPVRQALSQSSGGYFGNVQEVVDAGACFGPKDGTSCLVRVRVVELIGDPRGACADFVVGQEFDVVEMRMEQPWPRRAAGRRRLAITASTDRADVYGNTILLPDPTPEQRRLLLELMTGVEAKRSST